MAEELKPQAQETESVSHPDQVSTTSSEEEKHAKKTKKEKHDQEKRVEQLQQEIGKLKEERERLEDAYKRKVAEFDNYKKRIQKEMEELRFQANKKLLQHILPVYDNFSRAMATVETASKENLQKGLSIILAEFTKVIEDAGVRPIECVGQEFDYARHEALMMEEREDVPFSMTVIQELERGYMLGEDVLRPSKVKVAKKVVPQQGTSDQSPQEEKKQ
ncbi:MAG: nucleotide exchange factor GrpE [Brevinematales bacterium]|nr:nucleotide exchange factor GrpE [Brevinematales bacterium]